MSTSDKEIFREFLLETYENLALLDSDLVSLERNPSEKSAIAQVFRTLHTIKGTAGFMGLLKLQAVAHASESLLSRLRSGELHLTPIIATALLRVVDAIRDMLTHIEASHTEGDSDYSELIAEVDRLRVAGDISPGDSLPAVVEPRLPLPLANSAQPPFGSKIAAALQPASSQTPPIEPDLGATTSWDSSPMTTNQAGTAAAVVSAEEFNSKELLSGFKSTTVADSNIRVDVGLLDKLMTLVGELVLARNQLVQLSAANEDDDFLGALQRLNLLTTELQASVMKTRMQPIGNVLNKFPRVVRDMALACGKRIRFEMEGQETELDKTLIESIRDPLAHMVRNAIDHGLETPEVRKSLGKPEEGCLRINAFHEGGKVIIEIADDGAGIDLARVCDKALSAQLVTQEAVAGMSRQELLQLVFMPGFSTATQVTQFSGRGVGMDVVRTNIEKIGGTIELSSTTGRGTTIRAKIPLTLTILPALIITSGGERYAIPQVSLLELVLLDTSQPLLGIELIHGVPVYRLRGTLLPLVFLDEQLQLETVRNPSDLLHIVVLQTDERPFGLVVDTIRDTEEIVVKPLQQQVKEISVFAGAAIMGDGKVALVLDVLGLAERAQVLAGDKRRAVSEPDAPTREPENAGQSLLFFESTEGSQMALPLSQVTRLEEFPRSMLETLGTRHVVQYGGEILPLVDVSQELEHLQRGGPRTRAVLPKFACDSSDTAMADALDYRIPIVICHAGEQRVGLIVGKILDIVFAHVTAHASGHRPGVLYTGVVQEKVAEFLDIAALLRAATNDTLQPILKIESGRECL